MKHTVLFGWLIACLFGVSVLSAEETDLLDGVDIIESEEGSFRLEIVAETGDVPFGMDFLPDGRMLVAGRRTESVFIVGPKSGDVKKVEGFNGPLFDPEGTGMLGGMLDILVHPDADENGYIYLSYSGRKDDSYATVVERARLDGLKFVDREVLFTSDPGDINTVHHSARLAIKDGYLFIADGDRVERRDLVMDMTSTIGKMVRLYEDGSVPDDNPFVGTAGHHPAIWTLGHRDPQGLAFNPFTGDLWSHEHGPRGGDEINIIRPGRNYGWPTISYGGEYEGGPVGDGLYAKEGMEQPLYFWKPSIAPSSMVFYTGEKYPNWHGNLFIGAMAGTHLNRLTILEDSVINEERLLEDQAWRVRVVRQGPDGLIYIGIDDGFILRLVPVSDE